MFPINPFGRKSKADAPGEKIRAKRLYRMATVREDARQRIADNLDSNAGQAPQPDSARNGIAR